MKRITNLLPLLLLMGLIFFTACDPKEPTPTPEPTEEEIKTEQLATDSWTVTSADRNDDFEVDLGGQTVTLAFSENGAFTATNEDALPGENFPAAGTWEFATDNFDRITLTPTAGGNPLTLTVTTLSASSFTFSYETSDNKGEFTATVTATK